MSRYLLRFCAGKRELCSARLPSDLEPCCFLELILRSRCIPFLAEGRLSGLRLCTREEYRQWQEELLGRRPSPSALQLSAFLSGPALLSGNSLSIPRRLAVFAGIEEQARLSFSATKVTLQAVQPDKALRFRRQP